MANLTEKQSIQLYRAAHQLASAALAQQPGLPDRAEVHSLACAFIASGITGSGKSGNAVNHAGGDNEAMLQDAYEDGTQANR
jgi:hypothetical protein